MLCTVCRFRTSSSPQKEVLHPLRSHSIPPAPLHAFLNRNFISRCSSWETTKLAINRKFQRLSFMENKTVLLHPSMMLADARDVTNTLAPNSDFFFTPGFLSRCCWHLGSGSFSVMGTVLCTVGCWAASLVARIPLAAVVTIKDVSRHGQGVPLAVGIMPSEAWPSTFF